MHWLIIFLVLMGWVSDAKNYNDTQCAKAKKDLFEHLNLDKNDTERMWPLIFNNPENNTLFNPVHICVDLYVTSITNVNEKAQSLTTQVKMITAWKNSNMIWNLSDFCGIKTFAAPKNMFWTPDIEIMESLKTDFGTQESPYVRLLSEGYTVSTDVLSMTTACKMDLYRFPFDTQICNITLQSTAYSNQEITLDQLTDAKWPTFKSKELFQAQGEWELISINSTNATILEDVGDFYIDQLIYQITIKRRPRLYVINIILPVFFCLVLDVISFFIDTSGSDKLSFKVTLLLSISVMLLILKDTLPSTAENIPLIGVYCISIFCLIGISIVETILVNYLKKRSVETSTVTGQDGMAKGAESTSVESTAAASGHSGQDGMAKGAESTSVESTAAASGHSGQDENPPDSVINQNEETDKDEEPNCLKQNLAKLQKKILPYFTRVARIINVTFLVLYIITVIMFMSVLWMLWYP